MNYPDEILDQQKSTFEITCMFGCSEAVLRNWKKIGLKSYEGRRSCYMDRFSKKPDTFLVRDVLDFLQSKNKKKFIGLFNRYLYNEGYR